MNAAAIGWFPDVPRWVEARGMLLSGRGRLVSGRAFPEAVLAAEQDRLVIAMHDAEPRELRKLLGDMPPDTSLLVPETASSFLDRVFPAARRGSVIVHRPPAGVSFAARSDDSHPGLRLLDGKRDAPLVEGLPDPLRAEITRALTFSPVAAVFAEGAPVSFCYAAWETESLWDVSVDTLPGFRRRGFAAAAFSRLVPLMRQRGKEPVWGAVESNRASLELARTLGFLPVDRLRLYRAPWQGAEA